MRLRPLVLGLLLCRLALPAMAQDAPRPDRLVQAWQASQAVLGKDLARVELRERSQWTLDGPFGVQRIRRVAEVRGGPGIEGWERETQAIEVNDRRVPTERWNEFEERRRGMMGNDTEVAAREVIQLHQLLGLLKPSGRTDADVLDGVRCWRVELVPRRPREALERYTLWFDQTEGHLVRSRAVVRPRRRDTPFFITTDYDRIEGFDVPRRRLMEGTATTRRRLRTYTVLFTYEATYDAYRFARR